MTDAEIQLKKTSADLITIEGLVSDIERALGYHAEGDVISRLDNIYATIGRISKNVSSMEKNLKQMSELLDQIP